MLKKVVFLFLLICFSGLQAQETNSLYKTKKTTATHDTIHLENESINSSFFKVLDANKKAIDTAFYKIDFQKATLLFKQNSSQSSDSITIHYLKLPEILTKEYSIYDSSQIVSNEVISGNLYKI